ncbi:MAG: Npt1/Npt2 family nucleotide transporter [Terriglobia bacterium]
MESSRLKQWLTRLAPIYPGEGRVTLLCLAVNFLVVTGIMFGRNSRDSLFLVYFGVQYLPYMYFANAASLIVCSLAYTTLVDRFERGKFLGGISLLFIASLVASRMVLAGLTQKEHSWFFPVLYMASQVIWYFSLMQFWTFVGDLFDTRQAKRIFPFLAVGALLGMVSVGLFSKQLVRTLGTENLLLVWAGLIFAATALAAYIYQRHRPTREPGVRDAASTPKAVKPSEWQKIRDGFREVGREPLLRSMAGYILLMWTVYAVVDFCFNKTMRARYPNPNDLTTFFGIFIGVQGFLCLAIQLLLVRPVISRLGVGKTISFHPGFLVAGTAWMSAQYGYPSVLTTKLGDASMLYTFSDSSYQLLYNPVPLDRRPRVRGFIEGYIRPLSLAAAGGLILLGNAYLKPIVLISGREISVGQQLSWGAAVLSLMWLGVALTANKGYIRALLQNLQTGSLALRQAAATALRKMQDPSSLAIVTETLRGANADRVMAAIHFLENFPGEQVNNSLVALLTHADPRVRATAVSALGRRGGASYVDRVTSLLNDSDPRVRANVVEALAATRDPALPEKLQPLLNDPSTRTRVNTVLTIAAIQGTNAAAESLPMIRELARGDKQARSTATFALGRLPLDDSMDLLVELLHDRELRIRCEAAQALGRIGTPRVISPLIESLAGPAELRHDVRRALAAILTRCGESCIREMVDAALNSERVEIRSELADVLGRLKNPKVIEPLVELLKDPEWRVRWKVLKSFEKLARDLKLPEGARAALFDYAHSELGAFRQSMLATQTLVPQPAAEADRLLSLALEEDRLKIQERVFHMLGILCGRDRMLAIFEKLQSKDSRLRADALEALETLAPKVIAREVLGLLEPAPVARGATAPPAYPYLEALAKHPKAWIRACTAFYLGHHPNSDRDTLLLTLLADRAPLVRETALYAGWKRGGESWKPQIEVATQSSDAPLAQAARRILTRAGNPGGKSPDKDQTMLFSVEKVLFLKSAPLFSAVEGEELAALADIALEHTYEAGEIIFEEGQAPHHLYVVVQGKVEVFLRVDSTERPLAFLGEKECFGEMAILDDQPRSASVRAAEPTTVLKIDRDSFRELILERPNIAFAIFRILSGRLRHQNMEADHIPAVFVGGQYA